MSDSTARLAARYNLSQSQVTAIVDTVIDNEGCPFVLPGETTCEDGWCAYCCQPGTYGFHDDITRTH